VKQLKKVLLLDGYSARTLACVRSWGKRGVPFAVGGESRWDMSLLSKYCGERFIYTSPKKDVARFIGDINRFGEQFGTDAVFPTSEAGILACSRHRGELRQYPIIPEDRQIEAMFSKANALTLGESVGVHGPQTVHLKPGDDEPAGLRNLSFPAILKSESSEVLNNGRTIIADKQVCVFDRSELDRECRKRLADGNGVLVQEFINGYGVGISGIFRNGRPVALLGHRRIRESNPLGGPSALAETIAIEPELRRATTAMIEKIGLTGPAMVEYKIEARTGRACLMEINGRFWGSVLLALAAGLDLPYLYWKVLNGLEVSPEETTYRVGLRGRYLVGDTKCLALCLKGKPAHWPGGFPSRWPAVKTYVQSFFDKSTRELILTSEDPMPFVGRLLQELG